MELAPRIFALDNAASERPTAAWFDWALSALLICNGLDGAFTTLWVSAHEAIEANPLMAYVLGYGVIPFLLVKLSLVVFAGFALRARSDRPLAQLGLVTTLAAYLGVMAVHLAEVQRLMS
jgi:hypothetical protein